MKAFSSKQPYAYLICSGLKDIENRTWRCPERYIGQRVLIHASSDKRLMNIPPSTFMTEDQIDSIKNVSFPRREWDLYSCITGSVEIIDCVQNHPSIWAEKSRPGYHTDYEDGTYFVKMYNWVLANPVLFEKPIIGVKGKLGFWDYNLIEK